MPCHSGETHTSGRTSAGSRSTGKKVPENSVIGITTKRNNALNAAPSDSRVAANAVIGAATAAQVSTAASSDSTIAGLVTPPSSPIRPR